MRNLLFIEMHWFTITVNLCYLLLKAPSERIWQCFLWNGWKRPTSIKKLRYSFFLWIDYTLNTNISDHVGSEHFKSNMFSSSFFFIPLKMFYTSWLLKIKSGSVAPTYRKVAIQSEGELFHCEVLTISVPFPLASLLIMVLLCTDI